MQILFDQFSQIRSLSDHVAFLTDRRHQAAWGWNQDVLDLTAPMLPKDLIQYLESGKGSETEVLKLLQNLHPVYQFQEGFEFSFLIDAERGTARLFKLLETVYHAYPSKVIQQEVAKCLILTLCSDSTMLPITFRAQAGCLLHKVKEDEPVTIDASDPPSFRRTTVSEKITGLTDGIDHVFPIPNRLEECIAIVESATRYKQRQNHDLILHRFHHPDEGPRSYADAYTNPQVEKKIATYLVGQELLKPADYLVAWDEVLAEHNGHAYTIAEILRILLTRGEFAVPSRTLRKTLVSFYRQCLKIPATAIIGLKAGVFHVEHSIQNNPSYFFMGEGSTLGKGCLIDSVGGVVLGPKSFLGGGFMPILIHTHKHIKPKGGFGIDERKKIHPVIFTAAPGTRYPMDKVGLFESADFLDHPCDIPGIEIYPIEGHDGRI